jgi:hypothetical protein
MRPGNAVRHLVADRQQELAPKVDAVAAQLNSYGFVAEHAISGHQEAITSMKSATDLLGEVDLVVDATASGECSALLSDLADQTTAPVVAAVLQRDGAIYRIDRYPASDHYRSIERLRVEVKAPLLETGCADPISPATPDSVVEAAVWTVRVVVDQLLGTGTFGATVIGVTEIQLDPPFDNLGIVVT